ncbi:MAG: PAS domain S-box protein [Betaproteobacteria bacterium]
MGNGSLRIKILAMTTGIILFLGLMMVFFVRTALYKTPLAKLQQRGISIAKNLAQESTNPLLTGRFIELMIRDLKRSEDDIEYIFLLDASGEVTAHTFDNGFPVDMKGVNHAYPAQPFSIQRITSAQGAVLDIGVPLVNGTGGTAHVGISEGPVKQGVDDIIRKVIWIIAVTLAVGIVSAFILSASITKPVRELAAAAQAVENGNLSTRVRASSSGEIGLLGTAFNNMINARRKAEEDLKRSEKKLWDITASLGEGVLVVNTLGRLVFMNPEAERLLGWTVSELSGKELHNIIHYRKEDGTSLPAEECPSLKVLITGERAVVDNDDFVRKDGTLFPVTYISAPIIEGGTVTAAVIAFRDITQRKRIEAEREMLILDHMEALSKIKTLSGMLPICASCKRIRDDDGYWNQIESYIRDHSDAEFSHSICPECAQKIYPEYYRNEDAS